MYGAAKYLHKKGMWDTKNIESIYGTSVGAYLAILISLGYEWDTLDDYLFKRPWHKVYPCVNGSTTDNLMRLFKDKGVVTLAQFMESCRPLLLGRDIPVTVTMKEYFQRTRIDLHFYCIELNTFTLIDMSHKTHPDLSLVEACYMSACVPFAFKPMIRDGKCYVDGALLCNYPINECLIQKKCALEEVLGFNILWEKNKQQLNEESGVFKFLGAYVIHIFYHLWIGREYTKIPNQVMCSPDMCMEMGDWSECVRSEARRRELCKRGEMYGSIFFMYKQSQDTSPDAAKVIKLETSSLDYSCSTPVPSVILESLDENSGMAAAAAAMAEAAAAEAEAEDSGGTSSTSSSASAASATDGGGVFGSEPSSMVAVVAAGVMHTEMSVEVVDGEGVKCDNSC